MKKKNCLHVQIHILLTFTYPCPNLGYLSPCESLTVKLIDHFNIIATEILLYQKIFRTPGFQNL